MPFYWATYLRYCFSCITHPHWALKKIQKYALVVICTSRIPGISGISACNLSHKSQCSACVFVRTIKLWGCVCPICLNQNPAIKSTEQDCWQTTHKSFTRWTFNAQHNGVRQHEKWEGWVISDGEKKLHFYTISLKLFTTIHDCHPSHWFKNMKLREKLKLDFQRWAENSSDISSFSVTHSVGPFWHAVKP